MESYVNTIRNYLVLILLLLSFPGFAQITFFDLEVFSPLPTVDIGAFMSANGLRNTQRLFLVRIEPAGQNVILEGIIKWKEVNSSEYKTLYHFVTQEFASRNFANTDIGVTDVHLSKNDFDSDLGKKLIDRGKPTGEFDFTARLLNPDGSAYPIPEITRHLSFPNPSGISIMSPVAGNSYDETFVFGEWSQAVGTTEYHIKVGVRSNPSQSLEEALNSGIPLADNINVGNVSSVNLYSILTRPWQKGQEVVFQVTAVLSGPGGGEKIYSDIVNFKINSPAIEENMQEYSTKRTLYLLEEIRKYFSGLTNGDIQNFLENCGEIKSITDEEGNEIPKSELQKIIDYLKQHPEAITKTDSGLNTGGAK